MILLNKQKIKIEQFPNKESKIKDFEDLIAKDNLAHFTYEEDGDLIRLMFVKKRLEELGQNCKLIISYMPYSRMDRKIEGDLFTLKYICEFINGLGFEKIFIVEPHSQKTIELLQNSVAIYPALDWLPRIMKDLNFNENDRIVFPDKGAAARYKDSGYKDVCIFEKTRNAVTGNIENMVLKEGVLPKGAKCIIIDDLCSAGGTFLWASSILKEMGASDISLLVTHCEPRVFSGKLLDEDSPVDRVYTTTSMMNETHPKLNYITLNIENYV
ncbi:ribose-phosphate pyrophosphokinase [Dysgonomonas sp. Marseille-P4361]|uniref:ribose-phosphate pyrophosphokinase n=1 Tax=Dysgonomonas sp. Marseille-P4361 TaxID=2161820 RepID=UPI000D562E75|nr:ribose-phosphate pyrophosphokinase [Dysgonomonas sp. Marseille-P4361]